MKSENLEKRKSENSSFFYSYLITDPIVYGNKTKLLKDSLIKSFKSHHIDMVCFRDKETKDIDNIEALAKVSLEVSKTFNIKKTLINSNINLALKLGFDGVHLTSTQFDKIAKAKKNNLFTIISCHTEDEIKKAKKSGANAVTYSPIFYKENKGTPKGCKKLKEIVNKYQDDTFFIIALGGIVKKEHIKEVKSTDAKGFASIRYFKI